MTRCIIILVVLPICAVSGCMRQQEAQPDSISDEVPSPADIPLRRDLVARLESQAEDLRKQMAKEKASIEKERTAIEEEKKRVALEKEKLAHALEKAAVTLEKVAAANASLAEQTRATATEKTSTPGAIDKVALAVEKCAIALEKTAERSMVEKVRSSANALTVSERSRATDSVKTGQILLYTPYAVLPGVNAWIEIDGNRVPWPNDRSDVTLVTSPGRHDVVLRSRYKRHSYSKHFSVFVSAGSVAEVRITTINRD